MPREQSMFNEFERRRGYTQGNYSALHSFGEGCSSNRDAIEDRHNPRDAEKGKSHQ